MRKILLATALTLATASTAAATCPAQDLSASKDPLYALLEASKTEPEGQALGQEIWTLYSTAPDAKAQDLLDRGVRYIERGQWDAAEILLAELVAYCPDYAEGWNQRAFARFLNRNFDGALSDLDKTLELEPRHFGALAGRGLTFLQQGRELLAQKAIRKALKVHPWLSERRFLPPDEKI